MYFKLLNFQSQSSAELMKRTLEWRASSIISSTLLASHYFFLWRGFSHEKQKLGRRGASLRVKAEEEEEEERGGLVLAGLLVSVSLWSKKGKQSHQDKYLLRKVTVTG